MSTFIKHDDLLLNLDNVVAIHQREFISGKKSKFFIDFMTNRPITQSETTPCVYSFVYGTKKERDDALNTLVSLVNPLKI